MTAKAKWFAPARLPDLEGDNPFEGPVEEIGQRIDLTSRGDRLHLRLVELARREGRFTEINVTCEIKNRPDVTCLACPLSEAGDKESALGHICRIGREQEMVATEAVVLAQREAEAQE